MTLREFEEARRRRAGQDDGRHGAVADQHLLSGEQLVFRLAGVDEDRNAAAPDQSFGESSGQMGAETHLRPCGDDADEAALIGKHAARKIVDVITELFSRPQHLFARCRCNARAWGKGARHGRTRNARQLRHLLGADETHALFLRHLAVIHGTIIHRLSAIACL